MTDVPIPGLEPEQGRLDARYARFMGVCKSCRASILWATSARGTPMPVDVRPDERGNLTLAVAGKDLHARVEPDAPAPRYMPHHATCPDAARHRKAKR